MLKIYTGIIVAWRGLYEYPQIIFFPLVSHLGMLAFIIIAIFLLILYNICTMGPIGTLGTDGKC